MPEDTNASRYRDYSLSSLDRDTIRLALRGDVDMRLYVPEVLALCARLDISEPPWIDDESIRERVELNRAQWPRRDEEPSA